MYIFTRIAAKRHALPWEQQLMVYEYCPRHVSSNMQDGTPRQAHLLPPNHELESMPSLTLRYARSQRVVNLRGSWTNV